VLVHPLGAGRSPTDELGRKRRMTQFILRLLQARIKQVAEKESPPVPDFCQRTGLSFTILMNILFRKELPTIWMVQKILIAFPSINARWLLLGEGDMKLTKRNSFLTRINDFLHVLFASK
jgi:hypothetical protein